MFKTVTTSSLIGLGAIVFFSTTEASLSYFSWAKSEQEQSQLQSQAELETKKAESAKDIAQAYEKNAIADINQLVIIDYTLSNTPPQVDWSHTVDPFKKTMIFDRYRHCIGYAHQGKFYFTKYYSGVCNEKP